MGFYFILWRWDVTMYPDWLLTCSCPALVLSAEVTLLTLGRSLNSGWWTCWFRLLKGQLSLGNGLGASVDLGLLLKLSCCRFMSGFLFQHCVGYFKVCQKSLWTLESVCGFPSRIQGATQCCDICDTLHCFWIAGCLLMFSFYFYVFGCGDVWRLNLGPAIQT